MIRRLASTTKCSVRSRQRDSGIQLRGLTWWSALMPRHLWLLLVVSVFSLTATAGIDHEGYNEYTIRPSDIPKDAPRFEDYPAKVYRGANATPDLRSHPDSRMYRTQLKAWAKEQPNFAGHYILATWGCGTDCVQIAIINARTGKFFHPAGARSNHAVNVHHELLGPGGILDHWHGFGAVQYRPDSRLLVLIGMPGESVENRGISYFVWEKERLTRIRFVPKAWYPERK